MLFFALLGASPLALGDGLAEDPYIAPDYAACIARIDEDANQGRRAALRWITDGGGDPAVHCAAIADLANDLPKLAATRLWDLAEANAARDPGLAARLYSQAADAFLAANVEAEALEAIEQAYGLVPDALELHLVAARVFAGTGRWGRARRALDEAEQIAPLDAPSLVLRGRAHQALANYDAAAKDVAEALNLNPDNIDALLLRGELVQIGYAIDPYTIQP